MHNYFVLSESVANALKEKKPIVALESTIISHGMPYPENLQTAKSLEYIVSENGCVPATIAIIKGKIHVGLSEKELNYFAQLDRKDVDKVSTRDFPIVLAKMRNGSTTVAATSYIASNVGIKFLATGGIGGVHRGVSHTLDISNDLVTMSKTNICVVSAGVKSILDIPKTLEMLETLGVPVVTYGSKTFPAFYTRDSGVKSPSSESDLETLTKMVKIHFDVMVMERSFFIANPISPDFECQLEDINNATKRALEEAEEKKLEGRDITPFLLKRIAELTENRSLKANIKLVESNARLTSEIARRYFK